MRKGKRRGRISLRVFVSVSLHLRMSLMEGRMIMATVAKSRNLFRQNARRKKADLIRLQISKNSTRNSILPKENQKMSYLHMKKHSERMRRRNSKHFQISKKKLKNVSKLGRPWRRSLDMFRTQLTMKIRFVQVVCLSMTPIKKKSKIERKRPILTREHYQIMRSVRNHTLRS